MTPSYTYRNGEMVQVEDTIVDVDSELDGTIDTTLLVQAGARLTTSGTLNGTVSVLNGHLVAHGRVNGTVHVASGSSAIFHGPLSGTLSVDSGATAHLMPTVVALGKMRIDGRLVNQGVRTANVTGGGSVVDQGTGHVRQPDETLPDGTTIYLG
ncbi:hypothetical protein [Subtercola sp. RTI3]|uniref:hypothetical protein n=1 Tax=Subtercola sp. RTI3 TaxID=3048639 RepID=UPI002B231674|nr:hypothetical protein [Subtercola sp. RTI3]MEA9987067.1 hypothetical protein [Subtercola sp. RTI3]